MTDLLSTKNRSARSVHSDRIDISRLFRSECGPTNSVHSDRMTIAHDPKPRGGGRSGRKGIRDTPTGFPQENQSGRGGRSGRSRFQEGPPAGDQLDTYEERAAIRQYDGGQSPAEAETAALHEIAALLGIEAGALRARWATHPDAAAYLKILHRQGPLTMPEVALTLNWDTTRAWAAEARLRAAGLVALDNEGRARLTALNADNLETTHD